MNGAWKSTLILLGILALLLVCGQLVLGQLILGGRVNLIKAHQHSGYSAVAVSVVYILGSLATLLGLPVRRRD